MDINNIKKVVQAAFAFTAIILSSHVSAQSITTFSKENKEFINELGKHLKAVKREDCTETFNEFEKNVKEGVISDQQVSSVRNTCEEMIIRKLRAYPYFQKYLSTVNLMLAEGKKKDLFNNWNTTAAELCKGQKRGNNKDFTIFIDFSYSFINDNALYLTPARTWKALSTDFTFKYENAELTVEFQSTDLICFISTDTIEVKSTSGIFNPLTTLWKGMNGQVNWSRAGLDPTIVYGELGTYQNEFRKGIFEADSIKFYHTDFFSDPIIGKYTDKLVAANTPDKSRYPKFESYSDRFEIEDIVKDVSYVGGFSMDGSKIYGRGSDKKKAEIVFYIPDSDIIALKAKTDVITFKQPMEINLGQAEIVMYFGEDSIYHPRVKVTYRLKDNELRIFTGESGLAASNFANSFHKTDIKADALVWNLGEKKIDLKMIEGAGKNPAVFESAEFFNKGLLMKVRGVNEFDPLSEIRILYNKYKDIEMDAGELAREMNPNLSENQIKRLLYQLVQEGFIFYEEENSKVIMRPKTIHYVKSNARKKDYDIIKINAFGKNKSASINLENYDIEAEGVKTVPISDTSFVVFHPDSGKLKIQKNRNMDFNGKIWAGKTDLIGKGFKFDYQAYNTELTTVDQWKITIPDKERRDQFGDPELIPLRSQIEKITGLLEIDAPINKSGRTRLQQFPKLISKEPSFIYYGDDQIRSGVYKRDSFYFKLDPFRKDSLNSYTASYMNFDGELTSAGIFAPFRENVNVQSDLSLGFRTKTPEGGMDLYGGKGSYGDSIILNWRGLMGKGTVNYQTSSFKSEDIIFYPEQLLATADEFGMEKRTTEAQFPTATSKGNKINWKPYSDSMFVKMMATPFSMYDDQAIFKGDLLITEKGLTGAGAIDWDEALLSSKVIAFSADELNSDTAKLEIKSSAIAGDKVTFNTPNVRARVDFTERKGEFKSNLKDISTDFAYNRYKTSINEFDWDIDAKQLEFRTPPESEGSYFLSTDSAQAGLKFLAKKASYNLETSILNISEIPEIKVADAAIIPFENKITILPEAVIKTLKGATIEADTNNRHHTITDVTVDITSKVGLSGYGKYIYRAKDVPEQVIEFTDISIIKDKPEVDSTGESKKSDKLHHKLIATGVIDEFEDFDLYTGMPYYGSVTLTSTNPLMRMSGFTQLRFDNRDLNSGWFSLDSDFDPMQLQIDYEDPKTPDGETVYVGVHVDKRDTSGVYTTILSPKRLSTDASIFDAKGWMEHDAMNDIYTFGDKEKILNDNPYGNVLKFDDKQGMIYANGDIDLQLNFGAIDMITVGDMTHNIANGTYEFDVTMGLNLMVDKSLNDKLGFYMYEDNFDAADLDYTTDKFQKDLAQLLEGDEKKLKKINEQISTTGFFDRPKEVKQNIVLTDLKLIYDPIEQTYRSSGDFGLMYIGDKAIHKEIDGYIEFNTRGLNNKFNIYIETSLNDYFYFEYKTSSMQCLSSLDEWNGMLINLDGPKRKVKGANGRYYIFSRGSNSKRKSFVDRMKSYKKK